MWKGSWQPTRAIKVYQPIWSNIGKVESRHYCYFLQIRWSLPEALHVTYDMQNKVKALRSIICVDGSHLIFFVHTLDMSRYHLLFVFSFYLEFLVSYNMYIIFAKLGPHFWEWVFHCGALILCTPPSHKSVDPLVEGGLDLNHT